MFGVGQFTEKLDRFQSYFNASNDLLITIVLTGLGIFMGMLILLRISYSVMERADRKKMDEFEKIIDLGENK